MKKTFNINVAGFPFIIDDDAYTLLDNYLQTIENAFAGNDETRELANDIESRVAELLMERTSTNSPYRLCGRRGGSNLQGWTAGRDYGRG